MMSFPVMHSPLCELAHNVLPRAQQIPQLIQSIEQIKFSLF